MRGHECQCRVAYSRGHFKAVLNHSRRAIKPLLSHFYFGPAPGCASMGFSPALMGIYEMIFVMANLELYIEWRLSFEKVLDDVIYLFQRMFYTIIVVDYMDSQKI